MLFIYMYLLKSEEAVPPPLLDWPLENTLSICNTKNSLNITVVYIHVLADKGRGAPLPHLSWICHLRTCYTLATQRIVAKFSVVYIHVLADKRRGPHLSLVSHLRTR